MLLWLSASLLVPGQANRTRSFHLQSFSDAIHSTALKTQIQGLVVNSNSDKACQICYQFAADAIRVLVNATLGG